MFPKTITYLYCSQKYLFPKKKRKREKCHNIFVIPLYNSKISLKKKETKHL